MKKKLIVLLLLLAACAFALAGCFVNSSVPEGGNGDDPDPTPAPEYTSVSTVEDLLALSDQSGKYKLANDIDVSGSDFSPIQNFSGILDGDNKTISGFTYSGSDQNVGLFSVLNGTVKNLVLSSVDIQCTGGAGNVGALCGTNNGTAENVTVSGTVSAQYYNNVGGIAGVSTQITVANCTNNASVSGNENVGGIVGLCELSQNPSVSFGGNTNSGEVRGRNNCVGGVVGAFSSVAQSTRNWTITVSNNSNGGEVHGDSKVGGIVGSVCGNAYSGTRTVALSNCSNAGKIFGESDYVGGIFGFGERVTDVDACSNTADITGCNYVGGYVGYSTTTTAVTLAENNNTITGKAYVGGIVGSTGAVSDCTNNGQIVSDGVIVEDGVSGAYVGGVAGWTRSVEKCTNNVDIAVSTRGVCVGGVAGHVDVVSSSLVKNCKNFGKIESNGECVGGIAGSIEIPSGLTKSWTVAISDNVNDGIVQGDSKVGGIAGLAQGHSGYYTQKLSVSNCVNKKNIVGSGDYVGGIYGRGEYVSDVNACSNTADITGGNYVGGYVGYSGTLTTVSLAENNNTIRGKAYVGGIAGSAGSMYDCTNNGKVISGGVVVQDGSSFAYVGGIVGWTRSLEKCTNNANVTLTTKGSCIGGIAGYVDIVASSVVKNCKNHGHIASTGGLVGGIAAVLKINSTAASSAWTVEVSNNENTNTVAGEDKFVGGIVALAQGYAGYHNCTLTISNNTNSGWVSGTQYVGGIVGYGEKVVTTESVWLTNVNSGRISGEKDFGDKYGYMF